MLKLKTEKRDVNGKSTKTLREEGYIPLVSYGPKSEPVSLQAKVVDFKNVWKEAGETAVVTLSVDGKDIDTLINEVAVHPVTGEPIHADFYVMEKGKPVEVAVPLVFEGESTAVKDLGGTLVKVLYEIEIEALPKDIPQEIVVDISSLKALDDNILVKDLKIPSGVTLLTDEEESVAAISVQEEEPEEEAPVDLETAVEVEQKGKKDEEGTESAEKES
ncbi:MAG TPA: 50S ribosomal protein L25 [Candidatus Paceibacterota bacterium]|nr:50S ribosomal protein L25 [Candidatus Paceibacterota bacterium]